MRLKDELSELKEDRDYWKARCVSAEARSHKEHLDLVASGYFYKRKSKGEGRD